MPITIAGLLAAGAPKFVDYSHWQKSVNGDKLKNNGIRGAIVKAGETYNGSLLNDSMHDWNIGELKRVGLLAGNYYFWHAKAGASKQANHYWDISKSFNYDFPPVIDVEGFDGLTDKVEIARQLKAMVDGVTILFGRKPIIYINGGKWTNMVGNPAWGNDLYFWFAQYNSTMNILPPANIADRVIMWQYTDKLAIPGLPTLDGDFWLKSEQELLDIVKHDSTTPPLPLPEQFTKLEIIGNFLRGRSDPIYDDDATKMVIFEKGQILDIVQPMTIRTDDDVPFVECKIPSAECTCWVSSNSTYAKLLL